MKARPRFSLARYLALRCRRSASGSRITAVCDQRMGIELLVCFLRRMPERATPELNTGARGYKPSLAVNLEFRCHGWKQAISRLGRQPCQRRQHGRRWPQRQQQLGRQRQRQSGRFVLPAVVPLQKLPHMRELLLSLPSRSDPTAKHSADFINLCFKHEILL